MKSIKLMSLVAALAVSPAVLSAETVQTVSPANQIVATQTGGFQSAPRGSVPTFGTLNGGFLFGTALVSVIVLATNSDSSSGTR